MRICRYILLLLIATTACVVLWSAEVRAQDAHTGKVRDGELSPDDIPHTLSYQGTLFTRNGQPVADGEYKITVRMYSDSDGLNSLWEDTYTAQVRNGVFSVVLGGGVNPLPPPHAMDRSLWLGVQINDAAEMRPLSPLGASPYAFNVANHAITAEKLMPGAVTADKISAEYVGAISINGQKISTHGGNVNFVGMDGIDLVYDSVTQTVYLRNQAQRESQGKGASTMGNTTIYGTLTVTSHTYLGSAASDVYLYGNTTLGSSKNNTITFNGKAANDLDMNSHNLNNLGGFGVGAPSDSASPNTGSVRFYNAGSSKYAKIQTAPQAADRIYTMPDAGANANFVMSEGTQTINGNKTLSGTTTLNTLRGAGQNHFAGSYELSPGATSATVGHTGVQMNSTIIVTYEDLHGLAFLNAFVSGKNPGVSFTATLSGPVPDGADARLHYMIINP